MESHSQAVWLIAVLAGLLSFFSPCVLPIIPGYLSMVSGLSFEQLEERKAVNQRRIFVTCVLFAIGLCAIFVPVGVLAGELGGLFTPHNKMILNRALGLLVLVFGLFTMGALKLPFLYRERRLHFNRATTGLWAAPVMGIAFGAGWTPCIGPYVTSLVAMASKLSPLHSAVLFGIYSAVFGLCFVVTGVLFSRAMRAFTFFQKHYRVIEVGGGLLLVVMGVLMVSGQWDYATNMLNAFVERLIG